MIPRPGPGGPAAGRRSWPQCPIRSPGQTWTSRRFTRHFIYAHRRAVTVAPEAGHCTQRAVPGSESTVFTRPASRRTALSHRFGKQMPWCSSLRGDARARAWGQDLSSEVSRRVRPVGVNDEQTVRGCGKCSHLGLDAIHGRGLRAGSDTGRSPEGFAATKPSSRRHPDRPEARP